MSIVRGLTLAVVSLGCCAGCASSRGAAPVTPAPAAAAPQAEPAAPPSDAATRDPQQLFRDQLSNDETRAAALQRLRELPPEELRPLVPMLSELARGIPRDGASDSPGVLRAEILRIVARLGDPATIPLFIEALEFTEESFEQAVVAADFLRERKVVAAVPELAAAATHRLPIKSPANRARLAAIHALAFIGDGRGVPALVEVLTMPADEQDFVLHVKAAQALGMLADPRAVPALIQGMFLTARGMSIFPECRSALVRIGAPALPALRSLLDPTAPDSVALAQRMRMVGGDLAQLPHRAAMVLGDLGIADAVPALLAAYRRPAIVDHTPKPAYPAGPAYEAWVQRQRLVHEHATILMALGFLGGRQATDALLRVLADRSASAYQRTAAAEALAWAGEPRAIPALLAAATSAKAPPEDEPDLRLYAITAAVHLAPLTNPRTIRRTLDELTRRAPESDGLLRARRGLDFIETCAAVPACLAKGLADGAAGVAKAAAFALGHGKDKRAALTALVHGVPAICDPTAASFDPTMTVLFWLRRLRNEPGAEERAKLDAFIAGSEPCVRGRAAATLLGEARITAAALSLPGKASPAATPMR